MKEVSEFIPFESQEGTINSENIGGGISNSENNGAFKVCATNLPAKPSFFTKVKNILFYEIKVELTPYEQKIEDEINEFLHQEVTWKKVKDFLFQEVDVTFRGKKIF